MNYDSIAGITEAGKTVGAGNVLLCGAGDAGAVLLNK